MQEVMPALIGVWRRYMKIAGPNDHLQTREFRDVVSAVEKLQKGLETGDQLISEDYFNDPALLGAYLLYDWVLHYQQGLALINEIPSKPKRVLDLASGPGAFSFAALKQGAREVIALDRNQNALKLAGEICGRNGYPLSVRQHNILKFPFPIEGKFDLITVGYCLKELFPDTQKEWNKRQQEWVKTLFTLLNPNGMILFVENSFSNMNQRVLALRDHLVEQNFPVQAPCIWKGTCPALQTHNPCYAQREFEKPHLIKNILRATSTNLNSLKMTYLIMRNPAMGWPELPSYPIHRVISPAIETHAGKRFHLCGTEGKKDIGSNLKEFPPESRSFEYLQRGIVISIENALVNKNHFDIIPGTRVKIESALNKPLPDIDF